MNAMTTNQIDKLKADYNDLATARKLIERYRGYGSAFTEAVDQADDGLHDLMCEITRLIETKVLQS